MHQAVITQPILERLNEPAGGRANCARIAILPIKQRGAPDSRFPIPDYEYLPQPQFAGSQPGPASGSEFSDFVIKPMPPEITRRTGAPVDGWTLSGGSEKLCLTSNRSTDSSGEPGTVSYKYVGIYRILCLHADTIGPTTSSISE